jgi:hypothetical protein
LRSFIEAGRTPTEFGPSKHAIAVALFDLDQIKSQELALERGVKMRV